ncbi:unspecified product [Leishmania tarentolae]|uniref:Unspecified product n=1 Tax=Leishmania tarentolae TaxID=5689 RepID=A0A640KIX7_LEITA|nr:unspecified product [Leishmania tarentolae]
MLVPLDAVHSRYKLLRNAKDTAVGLEYLVADAFLEGLREYSQRMEVVLGVRHTTIDFGDLMELLVVPDALGFIQRAERVLLAVIFMGGSPMLAHSLTDACSK